MNSPLNSTRRPGPATDSERLSALEDLENAVCELAHMAHFMGVALEDAALTTHPDHERLFFAVNNVERRVKELRAAFLEAVAGEAKNG
jgi:hypothetical protein